MEPENETRKIIEQQVGKIITETKLLNSLQTLLKRSERSILTTTKEIEAEISRVLLEKTDPEKRLAMFFDSKPDSPHESFENYRQATARILVNLLLSDEGKSIPGEASDFTFASNEAKDLWLHAAVEFKKILKENFGITPVFDSSQSDSCATIGFSVDAKWPKVE